MQVACNAGYCPAGHWHRKSFSLQRSCLPSTQPWQCYPAASLPHHGQAAVRITIHAARQVLDLAGTKAAAGEHLWWRGEGRGR